MGIWYSSQKLFKKFSQVLLYFISVLPNSYVHTLSNQDEKHYVYCPVIMTNCKKNFVVIRIVTDLDKILFYIFLTIFSISLDSHKHIIQLQAEKLEQKG